MKPRLDAKETAVEGGLGCFSVFVCVLSAKVKDFN